MTLEALRSGYELGAQMLPELNAQHLLPSSLDQEARGAHLAMLSQCWRRLENGKEAGALPRVKAAGGLAADVDIFRDETVSEVSRLEPLVDALHIKMETLLSQWPEHPALQLVVQICGRLGSFEANAPLMKFVTGAELLLKVCWEWECNASRATSIKEEIDALTALVLRWRKMEVQAWPVLLEKAAKTEHEKALLKVWVRLFKLIHASDRAVGAPAASAADAESADAESADAESADAQNADAENADAENAESEHLQSFFETLESMLLGAEAAALPAYLELIRSFARQLHAEMSLLGGGLLLGGGCHLAGDSSGDLTGDLTGDLRGDFSAREDAQSRRRYANILHGLAAYYGQFEADLRLSLEMQRAPIEQKLTDFLKLAQWNDRNFVALKQSVERSHALLNRCVRQHKDLLATPANALLKSKLVCFNPGQPAKELAQDAAIAEERVSAQAAAADAAADAPADAAADASAAAAFLSAMPPTTTGGAPESILGSLLAEVAAADGSNRPAGPKGASKRAPLHTPLQIARLPELTERMRRICAESVLEPRAAMLVSANRRSYASELRETIVSSAAELRRHTDKKARQRKQKALSDLLKHLSAVGLSFHTSAADPRQMTMATLFRLEAMPLALDAAIGSAAGAALSGGAALQSLATRMHQEWARDEALYYRCVLRLTQVRTARAKRAHDDLSAREVHKASGFVEHGFTLVLRQREAIHTTVGECEVLGKLLSQLDAASAAPLAADASDTRASTQHASSATGSSATGSSANGSSATASSGRARSGLESRIARARSNQRRLIQLSFETGVLLRQLSVLPSTRGAAVNHAASALEKAVRRLRQDGAQDETAVPPGGAPPGGAPPGGAPPRGAPPRGVPPRGALPGWGPPAGRLLTVADAISVARFEATIQSIDDEIRAAASQLAPPERELLAPVLAELRTAVSTAALPMPTTASQPTAHAGEGRVMPSAPSEWLRPLASAVEEAVVQLMLGVQALHHGMREAAAAAAPVPEVAADEDKEPTAAEGGGISLLPPEQQLRVGHETLLRLLAAARAPAVCAKLKEVIVRLRGMSDDALEPQMKAAAAALVGQLRQMANLHLTAIRWVLHQTLSYHGATVRLELVLLSLLGSLLAEGFCTAPEQDGEGEGGGEGGKFEDDVEGTGMGQGTGKKDVSEEIEEEGQLLGDNASGEQEEKEDKGGADDEKTKEDEASPSDTPNFSHTSHASHFSHICRIRLVMSQRHPFLRATAHSSQRHPIPPICHAFHFSHMSRVSHMSHMSHFSHMSPRFCFRL